MIEYFNDSGCVNWNSKFFLIDAKLALPINPNTNKKFKHTLFSFGVHFVFCMFEQTIPCAVFIF